MKKGNMINLLLVVAAVLVVTLFAFSVRIGPAADHVAVLRTAGVTCGGCVTDIEKALRGKGGVAAVEVDLNGGWVIVCYDTKKIMPDAISATVAGAGYRNMVTELMSVEQFRAKTGRDPVAMAARQSGCGCGALK